MFGAFKRLFSKPAAPEPVEHHDPAPSTAPATAAPRNTAAFTAAEIPPPVATDPRDLIGLPVTALVAKLPGNLTSLAIKPAGATFFLPVSTALEQLPKGVVRIPFGQLRRNVPAGTFADNAAHDETLIELPLPQILAGIDPILLSRRPSQKRVEVAEDVTGVFGPKGQSSARIGSPDSPPVAPSAPASALSTEPPVPRIPVAPATAPKPPTPAPRPVSAAPPPAPIKPIAPIPGPASLPKPASPLPSAKPSAPAPLPFAGAKPAAPAPLPFASAKPAAPAPPPPAPVAAAAPAGDADAVTVALSALSEAWPETVRQEITKGHLDDATVSLPASRLEAGMKVGRLSFTWAEIRQWLNKPGTAATHGEAVVELPLRVVAPLFMAHRRPGGAQKKVSVGENIPDLFEGMRAKAPQPAPVAAAAPSPAPVAAPVEPEPPAPVPAPAPAPAVVTPPAPSRAPQPDVLGMLLGQPLKSEWAPPDIAQRIAALKGAVACVITTAEGLLVAGHAPAPLKAETLSAFAPQVFGRMTQYCGEMNLGGLTAVTVAASEAPCAILKAGRFYLGVVGRTGEALPEALLARIAAELAKRNP